MFATSIFDDIKKVTNSQDDTVPDTQATADAAVEPGREGSRVAGMTETDFLPASVVRVSVSVVTAWRNLARVMLRSADTSAES